MYVDRWMEKLSEKLFQTFEYNNKCVTFHLKVNQHSVLNELNPNISIFDR